VPARYGAERRYALEVLLGELLGLPLRCEEARVEAIELAGDDGPPLTLTDGLFAVAEDEWLTPASLPKPPYAERDGVPLLYEDDLLGSSFFLLTRYEEVASPARDEHGRYPLVASATGELIDRPLVDEYVELLWAELERRWPRLERRARAFQVLPSHDVDWPLAPTPRLRMAVGDVVRRRDPRLALRSLVRGRSSFDTFDWTMAESERRGLRSAFYFIAGHTAGAIDGDYSLDDGWIRSLLGRIHERGHEIGLHVSYGAYLDAEATRREADKLRATLAELGIEQELLGGRQHFLRWENPVTWRNWDEAGLAYDSTVGYSERPGFRCGTCHEFPVFDLRTRRRLSLRERPLVAMEGSLLLSMGVGEREAAAELVRLRETCRRFDGAFTILWHNNLLASPRKRRAYLEALA
jgi:peptidoglycan/xylan/chitin deacetylase (PgdA/CDA1 family)